jgi:heme/copper-type cytochrome/quinol oxidase subunit 3
MSDLQSSPAEVAVVDIAAHERKAALGAYWTGSRLFVAVSAMVFGGGMFAYFYLRSLNGNGLWRMAGQRPSDFISVPVLILTLAASVVYLVSTRRTLRGQGSGADWRVATGVTLLFLLVAAGIQLWGMRRLPFFPGESGFASVYVAVMPLFAVWLLIGAYWVETLLARSLRVRWVTSPVGENADSDEAVAFTGSLEGSRLFVGFLGLLVIVLYVLFSVLN